MADFTTQGQGTPADYPNLNPYSNGTVDGNSSVNADTQQKVNGTLEATRNCKVGATTATQLPSSFGKKRERGCLAYTDTAVTPAVLL